MRSQRPVVFAIIMSLRGHRVGRLGEVTGKAIEDADWNPLVLRTKDDPDGEMGRRIFVRWDLTAGGGQPRRDRATASRSPFRERRVATHYRRDQFGGRSTVSRQR